MVRLVIPEDDLYARLELTADATPEAIELAWRALLRRHHPDVAGDHAAALDAAKRINVAHDWLSDPALRARYDEERLARRRRASLGVRPRSAARRGTEAPWRPVSTREDAGARARARARVLDADPAQRVTRFLERVARLSVDELDRLSVAEPPPIAFVATIRRFLPPAVDAELGTVEARLAAAVAPERWVDLPIREALRGVAAEIVLGRALDELLAEPFRGRARERLVRAWEAALDQPRYGPNGEDVLALRERAARLDRAALARLLRAATGIDAAERPWPSGLDPADDEGLRVSAALAERDVVASTPLDGLGPAQATRARRLLGRTAHVTALRHAFPAATLRALLAPWHAAIDARPARDGVRGPAAPGVRRATG